MSVLVWSINICIYYLRLQPDFEYVPEKAIADANHEQQIKELQRKMSALLAENLEISEMVSVRLSCCKSLY